MRDRHGSKRLLLLIALCGAFVVACKTPAARVGGCCGGFDRATRTTPAVE
jgi:hypothetical protein